MRYLKLSLILVFAAVLVCPFAFTTSVEGQGVTEAPTHDMNTATPDLNNGFSTDGDFAAAQEEFSGVEGIADGLGPCYNAQSCRECHQSPDTGGASQISEFRAGHLNSAGNFVDAPGGSLINDRAVAAEIQERVSSADPVRTFRMSLSTFGDGFVEAIDSNTLVANVNSQPSTLRGTLISVDVFEAPGQRRTGRFGWKNQQASLVSFSADAYLNEMGITSNFAQTNSENTSNGNSVAAFDARPDDPEDADNTDVNLFATFMRSLKAPGRGPIDNQVRQGESIFDSLGCDICHTPTIVTAPPGTVINGGAFTVADALGNKRIHPYGDYALHNVGTGDGIVQNGGQGTRNQVRTAPLWGIRSRIRLMHDGETLTVNEAILRHAGQATGVRNNYNRLSISQKVALIAFVLSL
jgi:CxxC motif-containing protein (DUF1111 family)